MGLKNVKKRLEHAFPDRHSFLINKYDNKVSVKIEITRELENS